MWARYEISQYSHIHIKNTIYGNSYYGVIFTDDNGRILSELYKKGVDEYQNIDVTIEVPEGGSRIYINTRIDIGSYIHEIYGIE